MGRQGRPRRDTPLARWLRANKQRQIDFRKQWAALTGITIRPTVISRWVRGESVPNQHSRLLIAQVTAGGVPVDAWADLLAERQQRAA